MKKLRRITSNAGSPGSGTPATKSWQARLGAAPADATVAYVQSLDVDRRLYRHDIAGSIAHATMLREAGLISAGDLAKIRKGLKSIQADIAAGRFEFDPALEDIHMAVEAALIERVGDAGRKLHTARSRNDQVALDLRLWLREAADEMAAGIVRLQRALLGQATAHRGLIMPAYTHLQRAQPVDVAAYVLAYVEMLGRDGGRFADCRRRINVCPLGAGAVAGTTLPINRQRVAELLGFDAVADNSIDAIGERDVAAEFVFCCAITGVHLSRWAEDSILFASQEFGFLRIDDAYCTSSSMMPQKRNPDLLELMRGKSASVLGQLAGLLALLKGLPLAYNRDLQEDKALIFTAADAVASSLGVAAEIAAHSRFVPERLADRLDRGFMDATALAEYLVGKGVPFRTAHQVVGGLVGQVGDAGRLADLPLDRLRAACDRIGPDVYDCLGPANVVARYRSRGAGGGAPLDEQLASWKKRLA